MLITLRLTEKEVIQMRSCLMLGMLEVLNKETTAFEEIEHIVEKFDDATNVGGDK